MYCTSGPSPRVSNGLEPAVEGREGISYSHSVIGPSFVIFLASCYTFDGKSEANIFFGIFVLTIWYFCAHVTLLVPECLPRRLMEASKYCSRFESWLLGRLGTFRPGEVRLQIKETLESKQRA